MTQPLTTAFFARDVPTVARDLIGSELVVDGVGGVIVETEAYHHTDPASHSYRGRSARNASLFGPVGRAYVYRSHGLHWCLCFVSGTEHGGAVLVRALEPLHGVDAMRGRRGVEDERLLCSGPGRLAESLGVTSALDGRPLDLPPFRLIADALRPAVVVGTRIGISKAVDVPWRFGLAGSKFVSRPFRTARMGERAAQYRAAASDSDEC